MADGTENPATGFWKDFGDGDKLQEYDEVLTGSLATEVAEYYGLPIKSNSTAIGGNLPHLDIKRMDALKVIRLSLLEASAKSGSNKLYEPILNEKGELEFKAIGDYTGISINHDGYYEIQTQTWKDNCGGVMVIGEKPLAERKEINWKLIWEGGWHDVFDLDILYNNCANKGFCQYAAVVFSDPHEDSKYEDGIDNLYEITVANPWDKIIGYARYIDVGDNRTAETTINRTNTAKIVLPVGEGATTDEGGVTLSLGILQSRPDVSPDIFTGHPDCFADQGAFTNYAEGVPIHIPTEYRFESVRGTTVDKLMSVDGIYIEGYAITPLIAVPNSHQEAVAPAENGIGADIWVTIEDTYMQNFKLEEGHHYAIAYKEESTGGDSTVIYKSPYVVFANNFDITNPGYKKFNTQNVDDGGMNYWVDPYSPLFARTGVTEQTGFILPTAANSGILVKKIWAAVTLDTPAITIYDPDGMNNTAYEIASDLKFWVSPLVVTDEPAPVAFNGTILDQTVGLVDSDPTTRQVFENTEIEDAYDKMSGGGTRMTLGFLNENQCATLSETLYNYYNSGTGIESTYVCGPNANPVLGGTAPNNGIVNSITYSYQDSSSYTISVNAGSMLGSSGGFEQVDTGTNFRKSSNESGMGTVVQGLGNDIHFKVRIDGVEVRTAINMTDQIIRVGDIVQVTMYNNPVED